MGIGLFREYTLLDDVASPLHELFAGTKVVTFNSEDNEKFDIECVETGVRILCVDGELLA